MRSYKEIVDQFNTEISKAAGENESEWKKNHQDNKHNRNVTFEFQVFDHEMNKSIKDYMCKIGRYKDYGFEQKESRSGGSWQDQY
jgi:hypothetical protein